MDNIELIDKYFKVANYLSAAQLYLLDNPLLKRPLEFSDIKKNVVGHWGTVPGQNFIYVHLNRIIKKNDLNMIYISGPGHGGNALVSNAYIEGTYSEIYPDITEDEKGLKKLFKQFSFPGGISSHVAPEVPGSINEGGELGYSLAHAYGAVLDNPDLIAACVVGDGEAETGPLSASWHINKIINPKTDGVVLPILHLNGYKIANPTILARISDAELISLFKGYGYEPIIVEGVDELKMHQLMMDALDTVIEKIKGIKNQESEKRPIWPMIILKSPKGWTGPNEFLGKKIANTFRSHQVPINISNEDDSLKAIESWLRSYKPEELFDENGTILKEIKDLAPTKNRRMSANPIANGGVLLKDLLVPDYKKYGLIFEKPGSIKKQDMLELSRFIKDIIILNNDEKNFRIFGPDEALSNRLTHVFEITKRKWNAKTIKDDEFLSSNGRVIDSILSEHICEGLLEGYVLTGRHGFFHSYEAFIRIVDSMVSQHAKWLKVTNEIPWRAPISSLNILLTSHIWQQDHNGYTHQDPGFLNHLVTKKADITRMYLPPDTNCLLSCFDHCIRSKNYINVIVASKHEKEQWLSIDEAVEHCKKGIGIFPWASDDDPDIIMACCGDTPTLEALAATKILKSNFPELKVRLVNVVDLMRLQTNIEHPHGLSDEEYNNLFTTDKPIIFAFHGYASLIHQLTYKRVNKNLHVHGYIEEGTITTPFDMRVQNKLDRFHLVMDSLKYLPEVDSKELKKWCEDKLEEHSQHIKEFGTDLEEIRNWQW